MEEEGFRILSCDGTLLLRLPVAALSEARIFRRNLRRAQLRGRVMRCSEIIDVNLDDADLRDADLRWARLCRVSLVRADLYGVNLQDAVIDAAVAHASLVTAHLEGADLRLVTGLSKAKLTDATYDCNTRWPSSIRPHTLEEWGAIFVS